MGLGFLKGLAGCIVFCFNAFRGFCMCFIWFYSLVLYRGLNGAGVWVGGLGL